jgi:hypothetical protein
MPCCNPLWPSLSARSARLCRVSRGSSVRLNSLGFRPSRSQGWTPQWRRPSCCWPILFCGRLQLSLESGGCCRRRRRNQMLQAKSRPRADLHLERDRSANCNINSVKSAFNGVCRVAMGDGHDGALRIDDRRPAQEGRVGDIKSISITNAAERIRRANGVVSTHRT